jgi:hypothetical protein
MNLSDDQKKEIAQTILDCFKWSQSYFSSYYRLCDTLDDLYNAKLPDSMLIDLEEENPGLVTADIHLGVNRLTAKISQLLFSVNPFFKVEGEQGMEQETIDKATGFLKLASIKSDLETNIDQTLLSVIKFACGVGYVDVKEVELIELINASSDEMGGMNYPQFAKNKKFTCPAYTPCNLRRFFSDPDNFPPKWAIYQSKTSLLDLLEDEENEGRYNLFDEEKILKTSFPQADFSQFFNKEQFQSSIMRNYNIPIELLHFRGYIPIIDPETQKPKWFDCIATLANREELIQFELNQWHFPAVDSFIMTFMFPNDIEFIYPSGKIELSMGSFMNFFYTMNQRLMHLDRILNPMHWTDSKDFPDYIPAESGRVFSVDKGSTLGTINVPDIPAKVYVESNAQRDDIKSIFGANDVALGEQLPTNFTDYQLSLAKSAGEVITKFENKIIIKTGISKILQRYLEIGQLFLEKVPVALSSGEVRQIDKRDLFGGLTVFVDINSATDKPLKQQAYLQMAQLYRGDPDVDQIEFKREHFKIMDFPNVDKLVPDQKTRMLPVTKENIMMIQQGIPVPVMKEEDHKLHREGHQPYANYPLVGAHLQQHIALEQEQMGQGQKMGQIPKYQSEPGMVRGVQKKLFQRG